MLSWLFAGLDWLLNWVIRWSDEHTGAVALLGVGIAYFLYLRARKDGKRDAAKLIFQEIRYAEAKITAYRVHHSYTFTEKILPTNSWHKNIGLFVNDLDETELDRISKFYSNAAYLDEVIRTISDKYVNDALSPLPNPPDGATRIETGNLPGPLGELIKAISDVIEGASQTTAGQKLHQISDDRWYRRLRLPW